MLCRFKGLRRANKGQGHRHLLGRHGAESLSDLRTAVDLETQMLDQAW